MAGGSKRNVKRVTISQRVKMAQIEFKDNGDALSTTKRKGCFYLKQNVAKKKKKSQRINEMGES